MELLWLVQISIIIIMLHLFLGCTKTILNIKQNKSILLCGIFGFSGKQRLSKEDLRSAMLRFKIIGIYNESRGKDSCGVYINNEVRKGFGPTKLFTSFIESEIFDLSNRNTIFLGHTRSASYNSKVTLDNQHPFLIDDDLLLTHNGTLKETDIFCERHNLDPKDYSVDSQMLATVLYRKGPKAALESYKGAAALAYTLKSKPNTLYLYHGKAQEYKSVAAAEERPLYYLSTPEGIYYSSMDNALDAIRTSDEDIVYTVTHNQVMEIKNGEFTGKNILIERGEMNIDVPKYSGRDYSTSHLSAKNIERITNTRNSSSHSAITKPHIVDAILSINKESLPTRVVEDKDSDFIFYYKCLSRIHLKNKTVDELAHGKYYVSEKKGYIVDKEGTKLNSTEEYFYKGYFLKDKEAFKHLMDLEKVSTSFLNDPKCNYALEMSKFAKEAIVDGERRGNGIFKWYKDSKEFEGSHSPRWSGRSYKIASGFLIDIRNSHKNEPAFYDDKEMSLKEWDLYLKGGVITTPIVHDPLIIKKYDTTLFYDRIFSSVEEADSYITSTERNALDRYARWYMEHDTAFTFDDSHVIDFINELITECVNSKTTIIENIELDEAKELLIKTYDVLSELTNTILGTTKEVKVPIIDAETSFHDHIDLLQEQVQNYTDFEEVNENLFEFTAETEEFIEVLENIFDSVEELYNFAEESSSMTLPEAKEISEAIFKSIETFQKTCKSGEALKDWPEMQEFLKKLKNLKNGVV